MSPKMGKVGDKVEIEGKAYLLLLWEAGTLP